jgi:hypothetical protein
VTSHDMNIAAPPGAHIPSASTVIRSEWNASNSLPTLQFLLQRLARMAVPRPRHCGRDVVR